MESIWSRITTSVSGIWRTRKATGGEPVDLREERSSEAIRWKGHDSRYSATTVIGPDNGSSHSSNQAC
jgi:hypothetical protein